LQQAAEISADPVRPDPGNLQRTATSTGSLSPDSLLQEQVEARLRELAEASESQLKTTLASVPGVTVFTLNISLNTVLIVNQESLLEDDLQQVEHLCENTGALYDGEGPRHLLLLSQDRQPQYYINGHQVEATLELLELVGIKPRKVHLSGTAPLANDIALSNFEARPEPLNFLALLQRIKYTSCQLSIECRGRYKNLVSEFKKSGVRRVNFALSEELPTATGRQVTNQILAYGDKTVLNP
jgi:hypothetical protein